MSAVETTIGTFAINLAILKRQAAGLTHEDSLIQPPFRANNLNWVLGHIVAGRNRALDLLGCETVWGEAENTLYNTGSEPLTAEQAFQLETLLGLLEQLQERMAAGLRQASPELLATKVLFLGRERTIAEAVAGLAWHETYHTGQTELLRQLAGTDDKVI